MSNQFTEPAISGYLENPPTDDGATTDANEITWIKHTDKIGDPLKNYADAIKSAITTAFALNILNSVVTKSANYTAVSGDRGKLFDVTNTVTMTLLASATAADGFILAFRNAGSGVVTIDGNASETINGAATLVLQVGGWAIVVSDGTNWSAISGVDGVTATRAELNQLDASARAVTNYVSGAITHIDDDIGASSTVLDVDSSLTVSTWESVGPTGSGADNIWTAMDSIPAGSVAVIIKIYSSVSGGTSTSSYSATTHARVTGSSTGLSNRTIAAVAAFTNQTGSNENDTSVVEVYIPLDSSLRFDFQYLESGTTPTVIIDSFLVGWIK